MNERIKDLLMEARLFCYDDGTVSLLGETYVGQAEIQKFAELIVKECFKAAMIESKGHMNPIDLMKRMKERVGVEE